jgi:hypothetical protein
MRKKLLLGGGLVVALVAIVLFRWAVLHRPSPGVTRENFLRLHKGMREEDIEAILGPPTHSHTPVNACLLLLSADNCNIWTGDEAGVIIYFPDEGGEEAVGGVLTGRFGAYEMGLREKPESPAAVFRRWFGI